MRRRRGKSEEHGIAPGEQGQSCKSTGQTTETHKRYEKSGKAKRLRWAKSGRGAKPAGDTPWSIT